MKRRLCGMCASDISDYPLTEPYCQFCAKRRSDQQVVSANKEAALKHRKAAFEKAKRERGQSL